MTTKFKLIEKWICDDARANVNKPWKYNELNSRTVILGQTQSASRDAKPQRCRECGKRIALGETVIEFRHNFTEWSHWWFHAFIHTEACSTRINTMTKEPCIGPSGLELLLAALDEDDPHADRLARLRAALAAAGRAVGGVE